MAKKSVLLRAKQALKSRRFSLVISLLESKVIDYRDSFDFFYTLGTACLYVGDFGGATTYYSRARRIKVNSPELLVAQALLFLREGNISRALEYYLDVLEYNPNHKIAKKALHFIRTQGTREVVELWVENGRIKRFYPSLGLNPAIPVAALFICIIALFISAFFMFPNGYQKKIDTTRADLSSFVLSAEERDSVIQKDMSGDSYHYILTKKEITKLYDNSLSYFLEYRDNAAQVEINKIMHSNAAVFIRTKARSLMDYFKPATFDTLTDNYTYNQVSNELILYSDCWVSWSGRITNVKTTTEGVSFDLLVGYDDYKNLEGIVPVKSSDDVVLIDTEKPVKVLGKITVKGDKFELTNADIYQPLGNLQ